MVNLLKELIEKYIKENDKSDLITLLEPISKLTDNPSDILNIEINTDITKLLFDEDIDNITNNLKFIKRIFLAEQNGIHFDLTEEQNILLDRFISLALSKITEIKNNGNLDKYKYLLEKITKGNEIIIELDEITELFEKMNISYEERNNILLGILNHNKKIITENVNIEEFNEYDEEIYDDKNKTEITKENLKELLEKYSYSINQISEKDIKTIIENSYYEKVEAILKEMQKRQLKFVAENQRLFVSVLAYSNDTVLKNLLQLSEDKNFDLSKLKNITPIFIPKAKQRIHNKTNKDTVVRGYENFVEVINVLEKNNFDIQAMVNSYSNVFRISAKTIKKNIKSFNLYRLKVIESRKAKGLSSYTWLSAINLMDTYDSFIELGLARYVQQFTSKLTTPKNDLKFYRIYYAQKHNKPYYKVTDKTGDMFYLLSEVNGMTPAFGITSMEDAKKLCENITIEQNEYIESVLDTNDNNKIEEIVFENSILNQLEQYRKDILTYEFDGKLISRFKVLRLASTLLKNNIELNKENLLYLVSRNSILSQEQLDIIKETINNLDYGKEK